MPDAGSLLQPLESNRPAALPKDARNPTPTTPPERLRSDTSQEVLVQSFVIQGNRMLGDAQVQLLLKPYVGQKLSYLGLQQLAAKISRAYSDAGWVARVYLPEQDVTDGHVVIQIVEAIYGGARLQGAEPLRLKMSDVLSRLDAQQPVGKPLNTQALDRALLLIQDLPGANVSASLREGKDKAETELLLKMSDTPGVMGQVAIDNSGTHSTGSDRITLNVNVLSPSGRGDLITGNMVRNEGSDYLRLAYSVPVGTDGWRVGVNVSGLQYRVLAPEFAALNAVGNTSGVGLEGTYPLIRSRQGNLYLQLNADEKHVHNESLMAVQSDYQIQSYDATLAGNQFDNWGGGGSNSASVGLTTGNVVSNSDDPTPRNHPNGKFDRLHVALSRQQALTDKLSVLVAWTGQFTSNALESSQKFYLGGPNGVRAFPVSEAGGSAGQLANLELRYQLPSNLSLTGFYDWGEVTNYDHSANYSLHGLGLSLNWQTPWGQALKATVARRGSANPNPTPTGSDQDGTYIEDRFWLSLTASF